MLNPSSEYKCNDSRSPTPPLIFLALQDEIKRLEEKGLQGVYDLGRPGRPKVLSEDDIAIINTALRGAPKGSEVDCNLWDGKCLSQFIKVRTGKDLRVRQAQRSMNDPGFHHRKPRPLMAGDVE